MKVFQANGNGSVHISAASLGKSAPKLMALLAISTRREVSSTSLACRFQLSARCQRYSQPFGLGHSTVFSRHEHVSMLRRTHYTIWNKWLPDSGMEMADAPNFERYSKEFNSMTGTGLIEVSMPVNDRTKET